jgi:hypothetical protein
MPRSPTKVISWTPNLVYYRRKGQRRAGKRDAGVYAGLVLLGIYDRCTPALAVEVSLLVAMLGSLHAYSTAKLVLGHFL